MPGARINFSTAKSSENLGGLWTKNGLASMLQAKDMRSVTTVLPFVAALVDRMCGEEVVAPTTRVVFSLQLLSQDNWLLCPRRLRFHS
jgi:hypothetical protein